MYAKKNSNTTGTKNRLIIDFGNTLTKTAVFQGDEIIHLKSSPKLKTSDLETISAKFHPEQAIVSGVVNISAGIHAFLSSHFNLIELSHQIPVPIKNLYKTPETLGNDRLAVAVAAFDMYASQNVLVIDAGTCVTFDFVDDQGNYHGGGISPGINMRFKSLHTFTQRLPLVKHKNFEGLSGTSTETSILSGVLNGISAEFEGIIQAYDKKYEDLHVVITGGDMNFFAKKLKSNIFAVPNLVLKGLNVILNFNVRQQQENS